MKILQASYRVRQMFGVLSLNLWTYFVVSLEDPPYRFSAVHPPSQSCSEIFCSRLYYRRSFATLTLAEPLPCSMKENQIKPEAKLFSKAVV